MHVFQYRGVAKPAAWLTILLAASSMAGGGYAAGKSVMPGLFIGVMLINLAVAYGGGSGWRQWLQWLRLQYICRYLLSWRRWLWRNRRGVLAGGWRKYRWRCRV